MEALLIIFLLLGGWQLVVWLFRVMGGAASDVAKGRSTLKESVSVRTRGMSNLELKVEDDTVGEMNLPIWSISIRGLIPISNRTNVGIIISLLDVTKKDEPRPILSALDEFQEAGSRAFRFVTQLGTAEPGQGFMHWSNVGVVPKDLLMYPHSGKRRLAIVVRVVDVDQMPAIDLGFADAHQIGILHQCIQHKQISVASGYLERSKEELGVAAASLRLGLAIAYSDESFDVLEGKTIKEWAAKFVSEVPEGSGREEAREFINDAIRFGNQDAKDGALSISQQVDILNQLADKPKKYAAIELCLDIMAADGSADKEELKMLNRLCDSLGLDNDRFTELRDHRMINIESAQVDGSNIWESLGISSAASAEEKRNQLKKLYRRWNARAESLEDESEREKAHRQLELIAEARSLLNA